MRSTHIRFRDFRERGNDRSSDLLGICAYPTRNVLAGVTDLTSLTTYADDTATILAADGYPAVTRPLRHLHRSSLELRSFKSLRPNLYLDDPPGGRRLMPANRSHDHPSRPCPPLSQLTVRKKDDDLPHPPVVGTSTQ